MHLRLESLLHRALELGHTKITLTGGASPVTAALAITQSQSHLLTSRPHLVIVPRMAEASAFAQCVSLLSPHTKVHVLPHFDVSPYMGLYPKPRVPAERISFLLHAQNAKPGEVFVCPIGSLLQKTISFQTLSQNISRFSVGDEIPNDFAQLLGKLGYISSPMVEDLGQFSIRGGIVDIFPPSLSSPVRIELFGDRIESLRLFSPDEQRSKETISQFTLTPCREFIWDDENIENAISLYQKSCSGRLVNSGEMEEIIRSLSRKQLFPGIDFLIPYLSKNLDQPVDHFSCDLTIWNVDYLEIQKHSDQLLSELKNDFQTADSLSIRPSVFDLYYSAEHIHWSNHSIQIDFANVEISNLSEETRSEVQIKYPTYTVPELALILPKLSPGGEEWGLRLDQKLAAWKNEGYRLFLFVKNRSQADRLHFFLEKLGWSGSIVNANQFFWEEWLHQQELSDHLLHIIEAPIPWSARFAEERVVFLKDEDLLGKKLRQQTISSSEKFQQKSKQMSFGDLSPGDFVVHLQHGIGVYEGLKAMLINGVSGEYIQVAYKDKDKLYLPVYRVGQLQKYSGHGHSVILDKLGGASWEKTKTKVKSHIRDLASELLQLYAKRAEAQREPLPINESDFNSFEAVFPYDETDDQLRAINDILSDFKNKKPMDRLICGDVGFGKTEVAMRAAFIAAHNRRQVAILAPTTVLTFQHVETFRKRFSGWPFDIRALNRFVDKAETKKTLADLESGKVNIIIGTHRLLSKDIKFHDLGLLIIDEEQKFGVSHKEKIKKMRTQVDTLSLSATPIPRTLNMSLVGIRDLSIINTAPVDRLPTRTFILKWDDDTIRKAIQSEISRGGQVYFIHNRIQSIYALADEVRQLVPQARIKIAHGQMPEDELEKTMIQFFHHELDVLICTAIVESGMDVPRANTMFIDQAHIMGLSQLYQLRGRVGRSKERAYCYLLMPKGRQLDKSAQERLKIIQENTELGSGIRIAQHDLELRGAGDLLGESQSGQINAVGYELYFDLLNEAILNLRGVDTGDSDVEPEINLRIPALIPDQYISDIRIRLSYYKAMTEIKSETDLETIEEDLKDQFGPIPEPTINLLGLMLIRVECKKLGVRDISAGQKNISLIFTASTKMKPEVVIQLATKENKKYSLTPDNRLNVRLNSITWPAVLDELVLLSKMM